MTMKNIFYFVGAAVLIVGAFIVGFFSEVDDRGVPIYTTGQYPASFFDGAWKQTEGDSVGATSGLSAHHLLIAKDMATVFRAMASNDVKTVVLVSPNHFGRGRGVAQMSMGSWKTPNGSIVESDGRAIEKILRAVRFVRHDETAFTDEHGIYGLMPFVAKAFPNARVVSIVLTESLSADTAWQLGETIATQLPSAVLVASVDMTHYHDALYTAANDARVLTLIENAGMCGDVPCTEDLDIDSNASLRVLFGFNHTRGTTDWHLTHHGSSLSMSAAKTAADNTSHILGYFLSNK